jgi:D-proline reductase (dithiol) PrdB
MRIALITSGAIREANQKPFPFLGDASYRRITSDPNFTDLRVDHRNRFGAWARRDPETVFPRQALRTLADQGIIGSVAPFHFSISGGIELYGEMEEKLAPALVQHLTIGRADLAVFLPY